MKNYFDGIDDKLTLLQNRIGREIDLDSDIIGHSKMNIVNDAFATIQCAIRSVNAVMNIDGTKRE